jgi:ATP-binding cassette subfamily F protein 3
LQKVGSLSGGERCRAALARLAAADANFLVLDEPTNHLDLWARDALEKALTTFGGTVLFVSHDRYFVNRVADRLLLIEPGRVRLIEGNYDTYHMLTDRKEDAPGGQQREAQQPAPRPKPAAAQAKPSRKAKKHSHAKPDGKAKPHGKARTDGKPKPDGKKPTKQRRFPFRKVADIEDEIFARETCVEELQKDLVLPEVLRNGDQVRQITAQIEQEQAAIGLLYKHWEEATELNW